MTRKLFLAGLMVTALALAPGARAEEAVTEETETVAIVQEESVKVLRHVVLFRYKTEVTAEKKSEVIARFAALKDQIAEIISFEGGPNVEVEGLGDGFEHVFCVTFADEAARATYLPHPAHKEFVAFVGPLLDKATVADYWTEQ